MLFFVQRKTPALNGARERQNPMPETGGKQSLFERSYGRVQMAVAEH